MQTLMMFSLRTWFAFGFAVAALVDCHSLRIARSPDSVEANMPGYTPEPPNGDQLNEEGEYWQGEEERQNDRYEQDEKNRNKTAEENQQDFNKEMEYREEQQNENNEELQNDYENNRDKQEDRVQAQQEHYNNEHNNTSYENPDLEGDSQKANEEFNDEVGSKGERYNEKGQHEKNDREEKMENAESPSINYTRD